MKIFKFGGASVKDAESIRNVANILQRGRNRELPLLVISAMGKMTNAFEKVVNAYCYQEDDPCTFYSHSVDTNLPSKSIVEKLFDDSTKMTIQVFDKVDTLTNGLYDFLEQNMILMTMILCMISSCVTEN